MGEWTVAKASRRLSGLMLLVGHFAVQAMVGTSHRRGAILFILVIRGMFDGGGHIGPDHCFDDIVARNGVSHGLLSSAASYVRSDGDPVTK